MKSVRFAVPAAVALLAFTACGDPTSTDTLYDDVAVTNDLAASAGDAIATMLGTLVENETSVTGGADNAGGASTGTTTLDVERTHTCYDASDAAVNCVPFSAVRMIVVNASIQGTRSSERTNANGATVTWTGSVNRTANDTTRRIFTDATETSRVHTAVGLGNDTTTFTDGAFTRKLAEAVRDSVKALTFNLPRGNNPYPVSGSIVRRATVKVEVSKDGQSLSREGSHRVEVIFPADAQGNVTLNIDAKSCQLNLVTHAVTNCQ